jgi:hypothetical protein
MTARNHTRNYTTLTDATSHTAQERAITRLEMALQQAVQRSFQCQPASEALPSEHRREHRPGVQRRIDADPELQAFIRARIDRLTFVEIADEVAGHFPPARRVRRSAIHAWWKRGTSRQRKHGA